MALRWLRLLLSVAAASPGSSGNSGIGIMAQQIALIGFWQWLSLVAWIALSTPVVTHVQGVGVALAQIARPGPSNTNFLAPHPPVEERRSSDDTPHTARRMPALRAE
jgi:hypothetical protein